MNGDTLKPGFLSKEFLVDFVKDVITMRESIVVPTVPGNNLALAIGHRTPTICERSTGRLVDRIVSKEMQLCLHVHGKLGLKAIGTKSLKLIFDLAKPPGHLCCGCPRPMEVLSERFWIMTIKSAKV